MKAITTIRALSSRSSYGLLPRPPAENRIKLYGLYKQATEGNVQGIMIRPEGHTIEDEGAKKKWDAWKREENLPRTEAKRQYILYLINTMRVYASGTNEARELLTELEFLWDQIKDLTFADEDAYLIRQSGQNHPFVGPSVGPPLVQSYMDQSDRFSVGTPWPLQSTASVSASQHFKNNSEQIYLHSRRNTPLLLNDLSLRPKASSYTKNVSRSVVQVARGSNPIDVPPSTLDDFRTWQGQINQIINKLSRDFANRRLSKDYYNSDSEPDSDAEARNTPRAKALRLLRYVGVHLLRLVKNMSISLFAILFAVWCVKKNVVVQKAIVKKQLEGKKQKELVINMVINTDESKWFVRILSFISSVFGFA